MRRPCRGRPPPDAKRLKGDVKPEESDQEQLEHGVADVGHGDHGWSSDAESDKLSSSRRSQVGSDPGSHRKVVKQEAQSSIGFGKELKKSVCRCGVCFASSQDCDCDNGGPVLSVLENRAVLAKIEHLIK